jgi:phosphoketolase
MRVYEESKVNSAGIQEIYTDMASRYRANHKIMRHVNPQVPGAIYFEP